MWAAVKRFDVYRDVPRDLTEPTLVGGIVSVLCAVVVCILFVSELGLFMTYERTSEMHINLSESGKIRTIKVNINISLPSLPCGLAGIDVQDVVGNHLVDVGGELRKSRMRDGHLLWGDFGPLLHSDGGDAEATRGEGCMLSGWLLVRRVPGNFHISAHTHAHLLPMLAGGHPLNVSHHIYELSFGEHPDSLDVADAQLNPLEGTQYIVAEDQTDFTSRSYEYYIKVVPIAYSNAATSTVIDTFQYVADENELIGRNQMPAIYFRYDFSPVAVKYEVRSRSLAHFLVQICAIIGGIFTVLGLANSFLRSSLKHVLKKADMGKLG